MKLMIASDLHGSAFYCQKLLEAFEAEQADRLILLGDLLYHGPRNALPLDYDPGKTAELLNQYADKIICLKGNCDSEVDQMILNFPVQSQSSYLIVNDRIIHVLHGHQLPQAAETLQPHDVLLYGHTHVPDWHEDERGILWLNPGSVSIPKEESAHSYMILDGSSASWKTLGQTEYHSLRL